MKRLLRAHRPRRRGAVAATGLLTVALAAGAVTQASGLSAGNSHAAEPTYAVSPNSVAFGSVVVGEVSVQPQHLTFQNSGTEPFTVTSVSLTGTDPGDYRLGPDTCSGVTLASSATCVVTVNFAPRTVGWKSAHVGMSVAANDPTTPAARTALRSVSQTSYLVGRAIPAQSPTAECQGTRATIVGTGGDDLLGGTFRRDVIVARGGNDRVSGLGAGDLVCGGPGHDQLLGGPGVDRLVGGAGNDVLKGGPGPDQLFGGPGDDVLDGGPGRDRLIR